MTEIASPCFYSFLFLFLFLLWDRDLDKRAKEKMKKFIKVVKPVLVIGLFVFLSFVFLKDLEYIE